jgi:hypothetical protein
MSGAIFPYAFWGAEEQLQLLVYVQRYQVSSKVHGKALVPLVHKLRDVITERIECYINSFHTSFSSLSFSLLQVRGIVKNALLRRQWKHVSPTKSCTCAVAQSCDIIIPLSNPHSVDVNQFVLRGFSIDRICYQSLTTTRKFYSNKRCQQIY